MSKAAKPQCTPKIRIERERVFIRYGQWPCVNIFRCASMRILAMFAHMCPSICCWRMAIPSFNAPFLPFINVIQQMCHQQSIIRARSCFCLEFIWNRVVSVMAFTVTDIGQAPQFLNFFLIFLDFPQIYLDLFLNLFGWIYMRSNCICRGFSSNGYWPAATIWPQSHKEMGEARILTTETVSNKRKHPKPMHHIFPEDNLLAFDISIH